MIVYTPSTGRVHVRAGNRTLRHTIAERFIETALDQTYSNQPVDFQAYDISQFLKGFDLVPPELDDVVIERAKVTDLIGVDAELVLRVVIDGYTQAEAGKEIGLSEPAARKRFQRALKRLRDHAEQKS